MISLDRNRPASVRQDLRMAIVGLGGAGSTALDRMVLDGLTGASLVAINTDAQALAGSVAAEKIQLGRSLTRGLGAGGDPEIGYLAAKEAVGEIRAVLADAELVILCVGLGGGTGSGGARLVAELAREQGALVVVVATLPFAFEGRRRSEQAHEALAALRGDVDLTICFENDKMGDAVAPLAGIQDAFFAADQTISETVRALTHLARRRGLMHLGFDELATVLRGTGGAAPRCIFGFGETDGANRANDVLARALKHPLMDKGRLLDGAASVLVNVAGGSGMTLNEVQILMESLNRHVGDGTQILFGVAVEPQMGEKMSVTILCALPSETGETAPVQVRQTERVVAAARPVPPLSYPPEPEVEVAVAQTRYADPVEESPPEQPAEAERELTPVAASAGAPAPQAKRTEAKQEQMLLDPVARGRFERSEPTIVDGQDLDVPTFLRRNVKVK